MLNSSVILKKVISLQALHEQAYKEATTLRCMMEGAGKGTAPKIKRKTKIGSKAVMRRNIMITQKQKAI